MLYGIYVCTNESTINVSCPTCKTNKLSDGGFIPGTSLPASIGIVVGGGLAVSAVSLLLIYLLCFYEKKREFKPPPSPLASQSSSGNILTRLGSSPLLPLDKSPSVGPNAMRLYANSEDIVGGAAYMYGMDKAASSRQISPESPIMKDI